MQWVKYEIEEHFFLNVTGKFMKFHPVNQTAIKNHFDICQEASEKLLIQCNKDRSYKWYKKPEVPMRVMHYAIWFMKISSIVKDCDVRSMN